MSHLWSGRFAGDPDKSLLDFGASLSFDRRLLLDDVTGSLAWSEGLERAGVLSNEDASAIRGGLEDIRLRIDDPAFVSSPEAASDEDVHSFVERELIARIESGR